MTPERKAKLEAAGHKVMSPADFFGLDETDRKIVAFRRTLSGEIRRLRGEFGLTQKQLADRIEVSQSRVANIEKGQNASIDAILTAYVALGGKLPDLGPTIPEPIRHRAASRSGRRWAIIRPVGMAGHKTRTSIIALIR